MLYIGLDVHKRSTKVAILDSETKQMAKPYSLPTREITDHLLGIGAPATIVVETSTTGCFLARELKSFGLNVLLVDARKAHRMLGGLSNAKTDKLDAMGLCELVSHGSLDRSKVWISDEDTRELRELTRGRKDLIDQAVAEQNKIRSFLARQGTDCPFTDLKGKGGLEWLKRYCDSLSKPLSATLRVHIIMLEVQQAQIAQLDKEISALTKQNKAVQLLQTIPGIGATLSATIAAEIGDISRFASANNLRGYTGLVPRVTQSGEVSRTGPLTKTGNSTLRWALVLAAQNFSNSKRVTDLKLIRNFRRKAFVHGHNPAKVDLARHLTNIIFAMLRDDAEFDPERLSAEAAA